MIPQRSSGLQKDISVPSFASLSFYSSVSNGIHNKVWFSNRRARLRKQLSSSSSSSYAPLGVVGGPYSAPTTPYASSLGQGLADGTFPNSGATASSTSHMTELYHPNHAGHSISPNLPISDVKWEHSLSHNPYATHPIYSTSNLMPISQTITPTISLPSNVQPSTSPSMATNTLQSLPATTDIGEYKDGNHNTIHNASSPSMGQQNYTNMAPTSGIVTMLGPNSGNSNSNDASCTESNTDHHLPSQWHMSSPHQIRNISPTLPNQSIPGSLGQLGQPLSQGLGSFTQSGMQHGIHSYHTHQAPKTFGHQPFYGWY